MRRWLSFGRDREMCLYFRVRSRTTVDLSDPACMSGFDHDRCSEVSRFILVPGF